MRSLKVFLILAGLLHLSFMALELFPWSWPVIACLLTTGLPAFTDRQHDVVKAVVQNAGIYNGIVAAGLFFAAFAGRAAFGVARVLLAGVVVAGIFGALTLPPPPYGPALQAVVGITGLLLVWKVSSGRGEDAAPAEVPSGS